MSKTARMPLDRPALSDQICGVPTLIALDMAAEKLLANSDRWHDDSVFSRDLIDLAMIDLPKKLMMNALTKAEQAYGFAVRKTWAKRFTEWRITRIGLRSVAKCSRSLYPELWSGNLFVN